MGNIQAANIHSSGEHSFSGDTGGDGAREPVGNQFAGGRFLHGEHEREWHGVYSATETGGFLTTYRYHLNHWAAAEAAYGYDANSQKYFVPTGAFRIQSGIHQLTGSLVLNVPYRRSSRINPYLLAGGGALMFEPSGNQFNTLSGAQSQAKGVFVYGAGVNYAIRKRVSLRAEYRGLVYGTPDFGFGALSGNSVTHTAVPSVGLTYRF